MRCSRFVAFGLLGLLIPVGLSSAAPYKNCDCNFTWAWEYPYPTGDYLNAIWGTAHDDIWAGGRYGSLIHYDGVEWREANSWIKRFNSNYFGTHKGLNITGIWGNRADNYWAIVDENRPSADTNRTEYLLNYDGIEWDTTSAPNKAVRYDSLFGFHDNVLALEATLFLNSFPFVIQYNYIWDGSWTEYSGMCYGGKVWGRSSDDYWIGDWNLCHFVNGIPTQVSSEGLGIADIWGFANDDLWIATGTGTAHWDGTNWQTYDLPVGYNGSGYTFIWGTDPNNVWTIQDNRIIWHWDGNAWSQQYESPIGPYTYMVNAIWGASPDDVWAVGWGTIYHYDGTSWTMTNRIFPAEEFMDIFVLDENLAWATDRNLTVWTRRKPTWEKLPGVYGYVWATAPDNVWSTGKDGYVQHFDGQQWERIPFPDQNSSVNSGWLLSGGPDHLIVDSDRTSLWRWDGARWEELAISSQLQKVTAMWGTGPNDIYVRDYPRGYIHFDGVSWQWVPEMHWRGLVGGSGPDDVWVSGDGFMQHWNGVRWKELVVSLPASNRLLFGPCDSSSASEMFAGEYGFFESVVRWDGYGFKDFGYQAGLGEGRLRCTQENEFLMINRYGIKRGWCRGRGAPKVPRVLLGGYWDTRLENSGGALSMVALAEKYYCPFDWKDLTVSLQFEGIPTGIELEPVLDSGDASTWLYELNVPISGPLNRGEFLLELVTWDFSTQWTGRRWPYLEVEQP
jgi:hypothetical protein